MLRLVACLVMVSAVVGWRSLQNMIPNGDKVPNPCGSGTWAGVGHLVPGGKGTRNKFGLDFKGVNLTWTAEFCKADSDGDGLTNGAELGDPGCTWTAGSPAPVPANPITHPGICNDIDSDKCKEANKGIEGCPSTAGRNIASTLMSVLALFLYLLQ